MRSNFKIRVYEIVKGIDRGKVMTYKEVADVAGFPGAWRAVGNVLNKNKNPKIPCHRVIRSDGKLGGYNKGLDLKKKILQEENFRNEI